MKYKKVTIHQEVNKNNGIVFENREIAEIEKLRLSLCKINTEDLKFYYSEEFFDEELARKQLDAGEEIVFNEL